GMGAVLAPLPLVAPLVASGRLAVLVKPRALPEAPDFHLIYRKEDASIARIRSIRRWLKEVVATLERQEAAGNLCRGAATAVGRSLRCMKIQQHLSALLCMTDRLREPVDRIGGSDRRL